MRIVRVSVDENRGLGFGEVEEASQQIVVVVAGGGGEIESHDEKIEKDSKLFEDSLVSNDDRIREESEGDDDYQQTLHTSPTAGSTLAFP